MAVAPSETVAQGQVSIGHSSQEADVADVLCVWLTCPLKCLCCLCSQLLPSVLVTVKVLCADLMVMGA